MEAQVLVGHPVETIERFYLCLDRVLDSNAGDVVKLAALKAVEEAFKVNGTTISHCTFNNDTINT